MNARSFTATVLHLDESVLVTLHGGIDHRAASSLDHLLDRLPPGFRDIVVEAADVPFMDATGLCFLLRLMDLAERRRAVLRTRGWQPQPGRLYALAQHLHGGDRTQPATQPAVGAEDGVHRQLRADVEARSVLHRAEGMRRALSAPPPPPD